MSESIRVLLTDDDPVTLKSVQAFLKFKGFEVATAASGKEALNILNTSTPFQVIIADYRMPVMDGILLLKKVSKFYPDMARIIISGQSDSRIFIPSILSGLIDKYIAKPWKKDTMLSDIQNALKRKKAIQNKTWETSELKNDMDSLPGA